MSKIDDLYRRAFSRQENSYSQADWDKMESILDSTMPNSSAAATSSLWLKMSGIAAAIIVAFTTTTSDIKTAQTADLAQNIPESKKVKTQESINPIEETTETSFQSKDQKPIVSQEKQIKNQSVVQNSTSPSNELAVVQTKATPASLKVAQQVKTTPTKNIERHFGSSSPFQGELNTSFQLANVISKRQDNLSLLKTIDLGNSAVSSEFDEVAVNSKKFKGASLVKLFLGASAGLELISQGEVKTPKIDVEGSHSNVSLISSSSYSGGIDVGFKSKGFVFQTGVRVHQRSDRYKADYGHSENWEKMATSSRTEIAGFDTTDRKDVYGEITEEGKTFWGKIGETYNVDTVLYTIIDTTFTQGVNEYAYSSEYSVKTQYVAVPLRIGYERQFSNFIIGVLAGMDLQILSSISGKVFDPTTQSLISAEESGIYSPILYSGALSINAGYAINENLSLMIQPTLAHAINSTYSSNSGYKSNPTTLGCDLRLRYEF